MSMGTVGVAPGGVTVPLGDGEQMTIDPRDWVSGTMYSALVFEADRGLGWFEDRVPLPLFTYGRGMRAFGSNGSAHHLHTNVPRSGDGGLPQEWEGLVFGWYADIDHPDVPEIWRWIASATATFEYNRKRLVDVPLRSLFRWSAEHAIAEHLSALSARGGFLAAECGVVADALLSGQIAPLAPLRRGVDPDHPRLREVRAVPPDQTPPSGGVDVLATALDAAQEPGERFHLPIRMRQHIAYSVVLEQEDRDATERVRVALTARGIERALLWVHLDGLWKRPIV